MATDNALTAPFPATAGAILTVNAGSTSVRLGLFERGAAEPRRLAVERREARAGEEAAVLGRFLDGQRAAGAVAVVAHRVVHAGGRHRATCAFDQVVRAEVERHAVLAPLHNRPALAWEAACRARLGEVPAVAVFDSGFFAELPAVAATYALPRALAERHGLRRLGFHGLAHRSMAEAHARLRPGASSRVISFQLGGGCSAAALRDGRPIDTSMGFSPLEGLVMATRAGDLDPGLVVHLAELEGLDAPGLRELLNDRCGLDGLSGQGGDVRALLASSAPEARLALEVYCYRARKYLGAYLAALGGCDAVLFGGGTGERSAALRASILGGLEPLGLRLDAEANQAVRGGADAGHRISAPDSPIEVWVMQTDEESILAREATVSCAARR